MSLDLKNLVISTKTAIVEYPGIEGFNIEVHYINRHMAAELMKASNKAVLTNGAISRYESDDKGFLLALTKAAVKGWSGLTLGGIEKLLLLGDDANDLDPNTEVPFTTDNALMLMDNSGAFLQFINETVYNMDSFRTERKLK